MCDMASVVTANEKMNAIRKLFGVKRDPLCVYQVLSNCFICRQMTKALIEEFVHKIMGFSLIDCTNADNICKYFYIMTLQKNLRIGDTIRRIFMEDLENLFKDRNSPGIIRNPVMYRNLVFFFMCATHYMRDPTKPPVTDLISALLVLIDTLNCSENCEDLEVYSQAVAWIGGYFKNSDEQNIIWTAWSQALDKLRGWIIEGKGGVWALCCLEAATKGGKITMDHLPFYGGKLQQWQKHALLGLSSLIPLPSSCLLNYDLSRIVNYIQQV